MEFVDKDLDPEGTEKMEASEFMELMNTPKRWELVKSYIDPVEIYDSLSSKKIITEREYFSTFKRFRIKQDRIENLRCTVIDQKEDARFIEEVISFIQTTRRTLVLKKILHADDETLKKMREEQDPKNFSAKLSERKAKGQRILFPLFTTTAARKDLPEKTSLEPLGARTSEDSAKGPYGKKHVCILPTEMYLL
ncbi:hypothetical protein KP79_PYT03513 [Mizuhopecten yessoensis]|uniref:Uncharacterized protein n=2 Tax=Mizuhopecten yessoensis TaxID=6573 RepID=A0A210PDA7_MIZYE|nr:hypothetical protein KP79_PYT03513 [Mizuhopecten yessoensis]